MQYKIKLPNGSYVRYAFDFSKEILLKEDPKEAALLNEEVKDYVMQFFPNAILKEYRDDDF